MYFPITTGSPIQPAASLLSPQDAQYNQLHLLSLPDVGWNLMDPFFNSQKFSAARCRCLHGVLVEKVTPLVNESPFTHSYMGTIDKQNVSS